jgi:hypothetical protein
VLGQSYIYIREVPGFRNLLDTTIARDLVSRRANHGAAEFRSNQLDGIRLR